MPTTTAAAATVTDKPESSQSSARTVGTDLLLGDTEKLIEQLKLRRIEKNKQLQTKMLNLNSGDNNSSQQGLTPPQVSTQQNSLIPNQNNTTIHNNIDNFSTSSASSSSTNLSNTNESSENLKLKTFTVRCVLLNGFSLETYRFVRIHIS